MALDFKIGPAAWEALPADVKKEYKKTGSDYTLDLTGYEDPAALRSARDHEKEAKNNALRERDAEKQRADTEKARADGLAAADTDKATAVANETKKWETKLSEETGKLTTKLEGLTGHLKTSRAEAVAMEIASGISKSPKVLLPHILPRIEVELGEDFSVTTKFKDATGKPAALSADDIKKEFSTNPDFAGIIVASKGSGGGGAPPSPGGGGAPRPGSTPPMPSGDKPVDLSRMPPADLAAMIRANKEGAGV